MLPEKYFVLIYVQIYVFTRQKFMLEWSTIIEWMLDVMNILYNFYLYIYFFRIFFFFQNSHTAKGHTWTATVTTQKRDPCKTLSSAPWSWPMGGLQYQNKKS